MLGFGPRTARAARDLSRALYPDLKAGNAAIGRQRARRTDLRKMSAGGSSLTAAFARARASVRPPGWLVMTLLVLRCCSR